MKRTDMAKSQAKKLMTKMAAPGVGGFANGAEPALDRREQRKRDAALGLVPFAVKLNSELVLQVQTLAKEQGLELNEMVALLLVKGMAA